MKYYILFIFTLLNLGLWGQQRPRMIEDRNGKLLKDSVEIETYLKKLRANEQSNNAHKRQASNARQASVPLCTNGGFEDFENIAGNYYLKNFKYTSGDPVSPMQCNHIDVDAATSIAQYAGGASTEMASTVPAHYLDEFIGDINAFDQTALQVNYKNSFPTQGIVQAQRIKTNNETVIKFNYKAVLQTIIYRTDHDNEQPFFSARVLDKNGKVVDEFCLVGDRFNHCIFTQASVLEGGEPVLYTKNWQAGYLNISSIPNNEEFTIEFIGSRCGLNGHFGYAYVDDICLLHTDETIQGSIELDPINAICPQLPLSICGTFTIPQTGGNSSAVKSIIIEVLDANNKVVFSSNTPSTLDIVNKKFCFSLKESDFPNTVTAGYNIRATINYKDIDQSCRGISSTIHFNPAIDDDANSGWDISFQNCKDCNLKVNTTSLNACDNDHNGNAFFDLTTIDSKITSSISGLQFEYYKDGKQTGKTMYKLVD